MRRRRLICWWIAAVAVVACILAFGIWEADGHPLVSRYVDVDINSGRLRYRRVCLGLFKTERVLSTALTEALGKKAEEGPPQWRGVSGPPRAFALRHTHDTDRAYASAPSDIRYLRNMWSMWDDYGVARLPQLKARVAQDLVGLWQACNGGRAAMEYVDRLVETPVSDVGAKGLELFAANVHQRRPIGRHLAAHGDLLSG